MPSLDVAANLFLGRELMRPGGLAGRARRMRREAGKRLEAIELAIDPARLVGDLSIGHRQVVAIVKALSYATRDTDHGRADGGADGGGGRSPVRHHAQAKRERRRHRLHLASAGGSAADRRPGDGDARRPRGRRHPAGCAAGGAGALAGRPSAGRALSASARRLSARPCSTFATPAFAWRAKAPAGRRPKTSRSMCAKARSSGWPASWAPDAPNCSAPFTAPACPAAGKARSRSTDRPVRLESIKAARKAGIAFVTDDRRGSGLMLRMAVGLNLVMSVIRRISPSGFMSMPRQAEAVNQSFSQFDIRPRNADIAVGALSGGNQQKIVLAKEVLGNPRLLLARRADARRRRRRQGRDLRAAAPARFAGSRHPGRLQRDARAHRPVRPHHRTAQGQQRGGIRRRRRRAHGAGRGKRKGALDV